MPQRAVWRVDGHNRWSQLCNRAVSSARHHESGRRARVFVVSWRLIRSARGVPDRRRRRRDARSAQRGRRALCAILGAGRGTLDPRRRTGAASAFTRSGWLRRIRGNGSFSTMRFTLETTPRGGRAPRADRRICMKNVLSQSKTVLRARPDVPRDACRHPSRMNEVDGMAEGTVKCFNSEKGFGFIAPDGGAEDVFAYYTEIRLQVA